MADTRLFLGLDLQGFPQILQPSATVFKQAAPCAKPRNVVLTYINPASRSICLIDLAFSVFIERIRYRPERPASIGFNPARIRSEGSRIFLHLRDDCFAVLNSRAFQLD